MRSSTTCPRRPGRGLARHGSPACREDTVIPHLEEEAGSILSKTWISVIRSM